MFMGRAVTRTKHMGPASLGLDVGWTKGRGTDFPNASQRTVRLKAEGCTVGRKAWPKAVWYRLQILLVRFLLLTSSCGFLSLNLGCDGWFSMVAQAEGNIQKIISGDVCEFEYERSIAARFPDCNSHRFPEAPAGDRCNKPKDL
jgi:hypothetical protein